MSRLTDLIQAALRLDEQLGQDLETELAPLQRRLRFGLNFERHQPEAVEIPHHKIRPGSKVRILPARGDLRTDDNRLWDVTSVSGGIASLTERGTTEPAIIESPLEDLITIAEFRDPIYPGLELTGQVTRGNDKPFHTVINGENFHALETLLFTHQDKIDVIYIDPPYNSGAKDWRYNNNYVEADDLYRHSKWLAFMERRLLLAKKLLNAAGSVLIVTIDEKEYLRLGLLLEQTFPGAKKQMVSSQINPKATGRGNDFGRVDEYIYFVWQGDAEIGEIFEETSRKKTEVAQRKLPWETMRRRNLASVRGRTGPGACGPNQFYPIFVSERDGQIIGRGNPLLTSEPVSEYVAPAGTTAVFPVRDDGTEMNWSLTDRAFDDRWSRGYVRAGKPTLDKPQHFIIQYLASSTIASLESGTGTITGRAQDGSVEGTVEQKMGKTPSTQWNYQSHNAEHYGTALVKLLLPGRSFPFPKSLYAVADALRLFVGNRPEAVILDFFAGSGTTAHAVMRLNKEDSGQRQSISITNNEVSADEQDELRLAGLRPGDPKWEEMGICESITKPRITAAITGYDRNGKAIEGSYRFGMRDSIADGFDENAAFFTLTYESPFQIAADRVFNSIAPILWLRSGAQGRQIAALGEGWDVADTYGVIRDLDYSSDFALAVKKARSVRVVYVITDDEKRYQLLSAELPEDVEKVRLYEDYMQNFAIITDA